MTTMIREVVAQSITAVQNAHDLRLCDLIRSLRSGGCVDTEAVITELCALRRVMAADSETLKQTALGN